MYKQVPSASQAPAKTALDACPPGYTRGAAGQLVLADHAMIYDMMHRLWPPIPIKRSRHPDGEGF